MASQYVTFKLMLLLVCITSVFCDCYRSTPGCRDDSGTKRYRIGQRWKPDSNPCYTCKCIRRKVTAVTCKVALDSPVSVLKSHKASSKVATTKNVTGEISVRLTPKQAKAKRCPPTRAPAYNWMTGTFEEVTYQTVNYYYYQKESRCCNRFMSYSLVHPSCKVVKVGKCRSKVVEKRNPKKLCNAPMSMVG